MDAVCSPALTPELLILLASFIEYRDRQGVSHCRRRMEVIRSSVREPKVISASGWMVRKAASEALAAHCRACGMCRLARE